jgi:polysaccharide export outer membrane protein
MKTLRIVIVALAAWAGILAPGVHAQEQVPVAVAQSAPPQENYVIAAQDVLNITVWDHPNLTGKFTVQPDGSITVPLIGRVTAAGQNVRALETALTRSLADGFLRDPRVSVTLDHFRGQRIFIFGGVTSPGTYPLPEGHTLIEALARAGYGIASEAIVLRPKHAAGPTMPENAGDAQVFRVNLRELEKDIERGSLARNMALVDGDTIFVPRVDPTRVFVSGEVRTPGAYSITAGTTVLQALALAGGPTENAAVNRVRIVRIVDGRQRTMDVELSDVVQPGDTLVVPERFF